MRTAHGLPVFLLSVYAAADGPDDAPDCVIHQCTAAADAVRAVVGVGQLQLSSRQPMGVGQGDAGHVGVCRYAGQRRQQRGSGGAFVLVAR